MAQKPYIVSRQMASTAVIGPKKQCIAKAKKTQEQCKLNALPQTTVCKYHGGLTPRGRDSIHWKHGKYSKHLPSKVIPRYEAALGDPELMSLRHDIAVTEARLTELMEKIDSGEAGEVWDNLRKAGGKFDKAYKSGDSDALLKAVEIIRGLVSTGCDEYTAYREIQSAQEHRRRMTETENKMLISKQQMISTEQFMQVVQVILEVIQRHVNHFIPEKQARTRLLTAVGQDFDRLSVLETGRS